MGGPALSRWKGWGLPQSPPPYSVIHWLFIPQFRLANSLPNPHPNPPATQAANPPHNPASNSPTNPTANPAANPAANALPPNAQPAKPTPAKPTPVKPTPAKPTPILELSTQQFKDCLNHLVASGVFNDDKPRRGNGLQQHVKRVLYIMGERKI